MVAQLSWERTYLVAAWLETLCYGFFLCLFFATVYTHYTYTRTRDGSIMFGIGVILFIFATTHLAMNLYRLVRAYVDFEFAPGGPAAYLSELAPWDHVFKDTIYATTELFGDAISIYRCWVVWERNWKVIVLPTILLIVSIISGYTVCGLYTTVRTDKTVFDSRLASWISIFYSIAVVQSTITTGLMMYRIWQAERRTATYRTGQSPLRPLLWILLESAALLVVVEVVLLALYSAGLSCQYLLLEPVTPIVGITFTSITLRIAIRQREQRSGVTSTGRGRAGAETPYATVGTIPMRPIAISITKDVENSRDPNVSDTASFSDDQKTDIDSKKQVA